MIGMEESLSPGTSSMSALFHLDFIKSFAVNTDNRTLRHKGMGVNILYQPEDDA